MAGNALDYVPLREMYDPPIYIGAIMAVDFDDAGTLSIERVITPDRSLSFFGCVESWSMPPKMQRGCCW